MEFFNPREEIDTHGSKLPHWQQDSCPQFITFRERDSLPQSMLRAWRAERERWLARHPEPHDERDKGGLSGIIYQTDRRCAGQGDGPLPPQKPTNRTILEKVLMHSNGNKVEQLAWVIMPNHVHLLCRPFRPD